jgi:hypothetical protein
MTTFPDISNTWPTKLKNFKLESRDNSLMSDVSALKNVFAKVVSLESVTFDFNFNILTDASPLFNSIANFNTINVFTIKLSMNKLIKLNNLGSSKTKFGSFSLSADAN